MAEKRRAEESRKKEAQDKKKMREQEQKAEMSVRKAFQKLQAATPETFDAVRQEVLDVVENELGPFPEPQKRIREEAEKLISAAKKRVDSQKELQKKVEEKRAQDEARKQEVEKLISELTDLVDVAEAKVELLRETARPMSTESLREDQLESMSSTIKETRDDAEAAHVACFKFAQSHKLAPSEAAPQALLTLPLQLRTQISKLMARVNNSASGAQQILQDAGEGKAKIVKRIAAEKKRQEQEATFKSYDLDGDGAWNREEILGFTRKEYDFAPSGEELDRIFQVLVPSSKKGITMEQLTLLLSAIGVARQRLVAVRRREARQERERKEAEEKAKRLEMIDELKAALQVKISAASDDVTSLEAELTVLESKAKPLLLCGRPSGPSIEEVAVLLVEVGDALPAAHERLDAVSASIGAFVDGAEPELKDFAQGEAKKLKLKWDRSKGRFTRTKAAVEAGRSQAAKRSQLENEKIRALVVGALRSHLRAKEQTLEDLFKATDADGDGFVQQADFVTLLKEKCGCDLAEEKMAKFFGQMAGKCSSSGGSEKGVTEEDWLKSLRIYYKVVDSTVMTETISIKSAVIRRLALNEVFEALEGPSLDDSAGVQRIRGKAFKDGQTGWITVAGNQGNTYLEEGGNLFKVIKETELTSSFDVSKSSVVKKLKEGEILELLEWEKKDESGAMRIKGKSKDDGAIGWATLLSVSDFAFLKML